MTIKKGDGREEKVLIRQERTPEPSIAKERFWCHVKATILAVIETLIIILLIIWTITIIN